MDCRGVAEYGEYDCKDVRDVLGALIDGALADDEAEKVRKHLFRCAACRRTYKEEMHLWKLLDSYRPISVSPDFTEAVMRKVRSKKPVGIRRFGIVVGAVAAILLVLLLLLAPQGEDIDLSADEVAEILAQEELLANFELAEQWEVAALMDLLDAIEDVELESE